MAMRDNFDKVFINTHDWERERKPVGTTASWWASITSAGGAIRMISIA